MSIQSPLFVVAEMACSHEGKLSLARKIIDIAGRAGADAIQFQMWEVEDLVVPAHPDVTLLQKLRIEFGEWQLLAQYVRQSFPRLKIFACPYAAERIACSEAIGVDGYKIHSSEINNLGLLDAINATGKRVHLCTGAVTFSEIAAALERLARASDIYLLHGHQSFPTPAAQAGLNLIPQLSERFRRPVGYQDHSPAGEPIAFQLPAAAVGLGARVIEKHVTHDRELRGVDHEAALDAREFESFVTMIRTLEKASRSDDNEREAALMHYRQKGQKKWVARGEILPGTPFSEDLFAKLRSPDAGISDPDLKNFLGKTVERHLQPFDPLNPADLA